MADGWENLRTTLAASFNRDQGLPHPVVMAFAQDSKGFIWVGTQGGLSRFDGYRFHTYLHRDGDPASLPGDIVSALMTDAEGRLWVGTITGEICWYDPAIDGFHTLPEPVGSRPRGAVNALAPDGGGGLWAANNAGLDHIDSQGAVTRFNHLEGNPASLRSDRIRTVRVAKDGTLWVATYRGLMRKRPDSAAFEPVPVLGSSGGVIDDVVIALTEAEDGSLWFITFQSQVGRIGEDGKARVVHDVSQVFQGGPSSYDMIEGRPGELWIGRISGGITRLDLKSGALHPIRHELGNQAGLPDDTVRSLFRSRNGLIWAGTVHGLGIIDPDRSTIDNIMPSTDPGHLSDSNVLSLATAGQKVWLGYKDRGVALLDPAAGLITPLPQSAALAPGSITGLAAEPDGSLWIAAGTGRALYRLDGKTGKVSPVLFPRDDTSLIVTLAWQDNALWAGAGPLMRFDPGSGVWRVFRHDKNPDSLTDDSANAMRFDGKGGLWVGTRHGLDRLDIASGKFTHYLPGEFVAALLVDRKGRLWASPLGKGLAVAAPNGAGQAPEFHFLSTAEGLPNPIVDAMQEDESGRIWVSTDNGLAVIDPDAMAVQALGRDDGLAIPDYWINSAGKLDDGTLLFGGSEGLAAIHPERFSHRRVTPPVVVASIRIGTRSVPPDTATTVPLVLGPRERSLEVEFAALDYSAPDKLRYAYRLAGFDDDWQSSDAGHRRATYTNLPPGSYSLLLRATDRDGNWVEPLELQVMVQPAWWQSWWFRSLTALAAIAAIYQLVQLRTRFLQKRRALLEELVASQTRELTDANARLQDLASRDSLTEIYNRRHFLELAGHELERARRAGRRTSLLMVDVDHFKRVNDTHGHAGGDEVLRGVVDCIKMLLRDSDLFARIGGEELVVLMPETGPEAARVVAERLRQAIEAARFALAGDREVSVTASIGLAVTQEPPEPLADLLERADRALYAAKGAGRNRVEEAPGSPPAA